MRPLALGLTLLIILTTITPTSPTFANPDELKWSRVNIPAEGTAGNWVLASGSDVQHLTMATDGTLYCYASPSGLRGHNNIGFCRYSAGDFYSLIVKPHCDTEHI